MGQGRLVLHYDIPRWSRETPGEASGGVWAPAPGQAIAVGSGGTILSYDGKAWRQHKLPGEPLLRSVFGTAPNHVLAVGGPGAVAFYDGTSWKPQRSAMAAFFRDVWLDRDGNAYAVGDEGAILRRTPR